MVYNYYYQRGIFSYPWRGAVKWLLLINGLVYVVQGFAGKDFFFTFGLVPYLVTKKLYLWQVVTHMFCHGGFFHLLINLFILWTFGNPIEKEWGTNSFLKYYFTCGIGASAFVLATSPHSRIAVVGASGAIYGVLLAFAMLYPESILYLYFFFPIKAKHFALLAGIVAFLGGISGANRNIAHFGHLGGLLVGYAYLKFAIWKRYLYPSKIFASLRLPRITLRKKVKYRTTPEAIEERVNQILDKILMYGVDSLTEEEKEIMAEYSRREQK